MDLISLVYDILKPLNVPVLWQLRPESLPGITYHFFNEGGELYGDGEEETSGAACQIDIWGKGDYTNIVEQVKKLMKQNGFLFMDGRDDFESEIKVYHKILIFNYYFESEV